MLSSAEACTPLITYNELEQATNYWDKLNILGKGGFGVVFKGIWKNTAVAIKRLEAQVYLMSIYSVKFKCRLFKIYQFILLNFRKELNNNSIFWKLKGNNL